jgi:hypothetical protein
MRAVPALLVLIVNCSLFGAPRTETLEVRYVAGRVASMGGDPALPEACVTSPHSRPTHYKYPYGPEIAFAADRDKHFTLEISPSTIVISKIRDDAGREYAVATAELSDDINQFALEQRSRFRFCTLLIYLNRRLVGIDENGSDWTRGAPLGTFVSAEEAKITIGSGPWAFTDLVDLELNKSEFFWRWRRSMDIWEYACDEGIRAAVDAANPDAARTWHELVREVDCTRGPPPSPE